MGFPLYQIDAFTDRPFAGNPAAVCLLPEPQPESWMQSIASEMNLSETAFLHPEADGYRLRWFTPAFEVDLCGHATLASAHALWETGRLKPSETARFQTRSGLLTAKRDGEWIDLDFPSRPPVPGDPPTGLLESLGLSDGCVGSAGRYALVEVASEEVLRGLRPDFARLALVPLVGTIATCRPSSPGYDFLSRFFAPAAGIPEDPVTGSAHCCLGPFWRNRLGKDGFLAYQASARGGVVRVGVRGDRVRLGGRAVTVLRGELV
jgi:PhzF family phenazine biosynthesis protein